MRVRDMPTVEEAVRLAVHPDRAWELVTDIRLPSRAEGELQSVSWEPGHDSVAVGAWFTGRNRNDGLGEWTTACEVVDMEPGRRWMYAVFGLWSDDEKSARRPAVDAPPLAWWGFEVDAVGDECVVRQFARLGPGPSGLSIAIAGRPESEGRIIERRLATWRAGITANLALLRAEIGAL